MKPLSNNFQSFIGRNNTPTSCTISKIRKGAGARVRKYSELIERIAKLSFDNPEYVLFYRGQASDYKDGSGRTTLLPSLFRGNNDRGGSSYSTIRKRFDLLSKAEERLMNSPWSEGRREIRTHNILRWALLQHYEICPTPLLDVTQTLSVACSFGPHLKSQDGGYLYVLALPQISGSISASSAYGLQSIRLLSICPPQSLRPHYQDGYLLGEFPTIGKREKLQYDLEEMDFARRLICKFQLPAPLDFWDEGLGPLPNQFLFPDNDDSVFRMLQRLKSHLTNAE